MDRTSDFVRITVLFDNGSTKPAVHRPLSQDARVSQHIADQLRQQELFLGDLQALVSKRSVFGDDGSSQIASLTDLLKKELTAIDRRIRDFQQRINANTTSRGHHHREHFSIVTSSLQSRCAKSIKRFQEALQTHTSTIKERSSRRSKFSHGGTSPAVQLHAPLFTRSATNQQASSSRAVPPFTQPGVPKAHNPSSPPISLPGSTTLPIAVAGQTPGLRRRIQNLGLSSSIRQQQQHPVDGYGQQTFQYYNPRQDAQTRYQNATQVESTIVEISGMYTRMANMVTQQGEMISRIDDEVDIAQANVEGAQTELLKYYNMMSSNRSLILKLFLILLIVIYTFVVVF